MLLQLLPIIGSTILFYNLSCFLVYVFIGSWKLLSKVYLHVENMKCSKVCKRRDFDAVLVTQICKSLTYYLFSFRDTFERDRDSATTMKRRPKSNRQGLSVMDLAERACKIMSVPPGTNLDEQDSTGRTPLHYAAHRGYCANIEFLLARGASHNIKDGRGQTPLHIAARKSVKKGLVILVQRGAGLNIQDYKGRTPLHHAIECEQIDNIRYLLDIGANIDIQNSDGDTVLHLVSKINQPNILALLVGKGANLNLKNQEGMTALQLAVQNEETVQNVQYLVDSGAAMDIKNEDGETVLHLACQYSDPLMFAYLVSKASDLDIQDNSGSTVLHDAVLGERITLIRCLVEKGACIEVKNVNGLTPYRMFWLYYGDCYRLECPFSKPLLKLKLAGVPIKRNLTTSLSKEEESACLEEVDKIKTTQVSEGHYLHEIFTKREKPSYLFDKDLSQSLKDCVQSINFLQKFPIYGKTLRTIFMNADKTKFYLSTQAYKVINYSKNSWCKVTQDVWEHIFSFLRRRDLENFIRSGPTDDDLGA